MAFDTSNTLAMLLVVVGGLLTFLAFTGIAKFGAERKNRAMALGLIMLIGGLLWMGGAFGPSAPLAITTPSQQVTTTTTTTTTTETTGRVEPISQFKAMACIVKGNGLDCSSASGYLKIYKAGTDLKDPNAQPIVTITISSGKGTDTSGVLMTDTPYRVAYDGAGTYYDKDFGDITFPYSQKDRQTSTFTYSFDVYEIATIDDMLDETGGATDSNLWEYTNGENITSTSSELYSNQSDVIYYDISNGDGIFYIIPQVSISGANKVVKDLVWKFKWDEDNGPSGNEISSIVLSLYQGTDLRADPTVTDLTAYWRNQEAVKFKNLINGGENARYKLTITVNEANLDAGKDIWCLYLDDLGDINGKDALLNTGAAGDKICFHVKA